MSIIRLPNGKLLYFAHVPKCAGTAIERYLEARFGPLGMRDSSFAMRTPGAAWSLSPPQHMPEEVRRDLLPDSLFDGMFAALRHPATRLRSAFLFKRDVDKALPAQPPFHRWIETVPRSLALNPYTLHGHLRPMTKCVPQATATFRIEDGLDAVVQWLDAQVGTQDGPHQITPANVLSQRLGTQPDTVKLTPSILNTITTLYAADFDRFAYPINPQDMENSK
ncbi:sulfotransferase family 2 domain-containing protein [Tateyamaria pelophila]|uniref:sulfotransferase family 2 domain-containing protein n=1 Tax=Tateyamaria pelophila TaxID=328415 RepID=UPI001CBD8F76|nr:sulfotransferase family 2 domain-containing protein [Tateyamaria pelophila]